MGWARGIEGFDRFRDLRLVDRVRDIRCRGSFAHVSDFSDCGNVDDVRQPRRNVRRHRNLRGLRRRALGNGDRFSYFGDFGLGKFSGFGRPAGHPFGRNAKHLEEHGPTVHTVPSSVDNAADGSADQSRRSTSASSRPSAVAG